jgi:alpha-N-arabinofuranosidase
MYRKNLLRYSSFLLAALALAQQPVHLKIDATQVVREIDPKVYGQFLEHIYHSVNGGVWGEVVWNRSFEERLSPDDWRVRGGVLVTPPPADRESRFMIGSEAWGDYDYFADFRRTSGDGALLAGVRSSRAGNITLTLDGKQAELARSARGAAKSSLGTAPFALESNRWYRLHIHAEGRHIQVFVDDKSVIEADSAAGTETGQPFLGVRNAAAEFRGIRAVALRTHQVLFDQLPSPARHWKALGAGELSLDPGQPANSKFSLKISGAGGTGVSQDQISVRRGDVLHGSLWVRGESTGGLSVRLTSDRYVLAQNSFPSPIKNWVELPLTLNPEEDSVNATLEIVTRGAATLWIDQVSLMSESVVANGSFRPDLVRAIADLHPPVIRWPGGSFVANYHWKESIGPQSRRVSKAPAQWDDLDPLSFGIDEFMNLARRVGAEPIVVINTGAKDGAVDRAKYVQDARDFVEYCNAPATSKWGKVRAANGHPDPYNVKYWEIDNEIWGMKADDYVQALRQFIPAMKQVDPGIKTIACGSGGLGARWGDGDVAVIEQAADLVDYLSIHHYENPDHFGDGPAKAETYWNTLGEKILKSRNPNLRLFMSEWNAQSTDWRTGLYAGGLLNAFERSPYVTMASPALFLRHVTAPAWDNAFINFDNHSWYPAPNYVVMKLYHDHFAPGLLKVEGDAGNVNVDAAKSADGKRVVVKLVNFADAPREVSLDLGGFTTATATLATLAPDSLSARNTMEHPDTIRPVAGKVALSGSTATLSLARWSVNVLEIAAPPSAESKARPAYAQPDVLTLRNGQPVRDAQTWWKLRRPEILQLLETQEYGRVPSNKIAAKIVPKFRLDLIDRKALGGKAIRKQVTITFPGMKDSPRLHLLLYLPNNLPGPAPAILGLNFNGNQTIDADTGINLPDIWVPDPANPKGPRIKERAPETTRGAAASQWQIEKIVDRGYALATIYCGDIEPDFAGGMKYGVRQMFMTNKQQNVAPDEWGAIGAWAWGLSRGLDYLQNDSDINPQRVAVFGFSRLGKAAVWAGARDQRFALVISNESGQGGVGLSHRKAGETVEHLNNAFPHWFAPNFRQYIGHEDTMPVDGHLVLSLIAPRPAYVGSAELDKSSDPPGEFQSAVEASRVYQLLGKQGLGTAEMPGLDHPVAGDVGYHVRSGKHDVTAYDWDRYLDFMDRQFAK